MTAFLWRRSDAFLHRLNPLPKLALTLPVAVLVALADRPWVPLLAAGMLVLALRLLGAIPWGTIVRPLLLAALFGVGMFWTTAAFYAGPGADADPLLVAGPVRVTEAGLLYAATMVCRLLAIVAASLLFVLTTDPVDLVVALITQARLPAPIGFSVLAAYRFVPLVRDELGNLRAAHQLRGGVGHGPLAWARQVVGYAVPLLALSVRRAERIALAMEARGFGARPDRTYYRQTAFGPSDLIFTVAAVVLLAVLGALLAATAT